MGVIPLRAAGSFECISFFISLFMDTFGCGKQAPRHHNHTRERDYSCSDKMRVSTMLMKYVLNASTGIKSSEQTRMLL